MREVLAGLLCSHGMTVMATSADPASASDAAATWHPTVAVVEPHQQPGQTREDPDGLIASLRAAAPTLPLVVHTAMFAPGTLPRPERFHAVRIVPKGSDPGELLSAIRHAHQLTRTARPRCGSIATDR